MTTAPEIEQDAVTHINGHGERALWCAALTLLINDARIYWDGSKGCQFEHMAQAFDDVLSVGPMTRHLCSMADFEPEWVAAKFIKSIE